MKFILLAAGQGKRLRPYTDFVPKCMVKFNNKSIVDYILDTASNFNFDKTIIVNGYKKEVLEEHLKDKNITFYTNDNFENSNMLASLFYAENEFDDDIIISYSDIVYNKNILDALIKSDAPISTIVDKDWKKLWELRMEDPLSDAESMRLDSNDNIIELGKKIKDISEVEGQYIGLIKISKDYLKKVSDFYHSLDKSKIYDGKDFDNMFMTSFIQLIIDKLSPVKAVYINSGWFEVDSTTDLEIYHSNLKHLDNVFI